LAAWKRRNASSISADVHGGVAPAKAFLSAATRFFGPLTAAALPARALRRLSAVRRGALRGARRFLTGTARREVFLRDVFLPDVLRAMFPV
jgi:hypothetical protein